MLTISSCLLTSPRGITAARPPFFFLRFGARPLGYVDFGDLKNLLCLLEPLGVSERVLSPLDRLLGSLEALLEPPGVLLGASWGILGCSWGVLGPLGRLLVALEADLEATET